MLTSVHGVITKRDGNNVASTQFAQFAETTALCPRSFAAEEIRWSSIRSVPSVVTLVNGAGDMGETYCAQGRYEKCIQNFRKLEGKEIHHIGVDERVISKVILRK
jgi:hypothetical protein